MNTTPTNAPHDGNGSTGNWTTRGAVATGRGVVLFGYTLTTVFLWAGLLIAVALIPIGVGLPLTAAALRAMRGLEAKSWRQVAGWCGFAVAPSRPVAPADETERTVGFWARFGALMADPDTWRSVLWSSVDVLVGWVFTLAPVGLVAWGLFGVIMPGVWHPIVTAGGNNWYAFIHVTSASTAWMSVALGIAFVALGLATAPWFLRRYGALAKSLLAPAQHTPGQPLASAR